MDTLRVGVLQMTVTDGDPARNLDRVASLVTAQSGVNLFLLPELWTTGYAHAGWRAAAERETPRVREALQSLAVTTGAFLGGSMVAQAADGTLRNRFHLTSPQGSSEGTYDKIHLFAPLDEPRHLTPGDARLGLRLGEWLLMPGVCFDLRFPEFFRTASWGAPDVILVPAEWPLARRAVMRTLAAARAIENQCYLVLSNRWGSGADGVVFGGGSCVIGPDGEVCAEAEDGDGVVVTDLSLDVVRRSRVVLPRTTPPRRYEAERLVALSSPQARGTGTDGARG